MGGSVRGSAQVGQHEVRRPPGEPGAPNPCSFSAPERAAWGALTHGHWGGETRGFRAAERAGGAVWVRSPAGEPGATPVPKTKACLQDPQSSKEPVSATDFDVSLSN